MSAAEAVELGLVVELPDGVRGAAGELAGGTYRLRPDDGPDLEGPVGRLALQLALLAAVGPRPWPERRRILVADGVAVPRGRAELLTLWTRAERDGTALACDDALVWTAWGSWSDGPGSTRAAVTVVDGGTSGMAIVRERGPAVVASTARPTDVWLALEAVCAAAARAAAEGQAGDV